MKKTLLFLLLCIGIWQQTHAQTQFSSGGINYETIPSTTNVKIIRTNPISGAVTIPSSVIYNSQSYSVTAINDIAFYNEGITSIVLPSALTIIGNEAFNGCTSLTSITIPNSVTSIGDYAFSFCISLTTVTIPASVTYIGSAAFGDTGLTSVICEAVTPPIFCFFAKINVRPQPSNINQYF